MKIQIHGNVGYFDLDAIGDVETLAVHLCEYLHVNSIMPVAAHMRPELKRVFLERFISGMVGGACSAIGADETKAMLAEVARTLDEVIAERARATH